MKNTPQLRAFINRSGYNTSELHRMTDVSQSTWSRILNGQITHTSPKTDQALLKFFNLTHEELLSITNGKPIKKKERGVHPAVTIITEFLDEHPQFIQSFATHGYVVGCKALEPYILQDTGEPQQIYNQPVRQRQDAPRPKRAVKNPA